MIRNPNEGERCVLGGAIGGIAGGLALTVFALAHALIEGADAWPVLKTAALPLYGTHVFAPGFELFPVLIGISNHFAIAMLWGAVFGVFAYGLPRVATLAAAFAWGLVVWFGMHFVVLRLMGWGEVTASMPIGLALFEHLLFGLAMGIGFLPFQRPYAVSEAAPA